MYQVYMKKKIANSTDKIGVCVDDSLHAGLHSIMSDFRAEIHEKYSPDSLGSFGMSSWRQCQHSQNRDVGIQC